MKASVEKLTKYRIVMEIPPNRNMLSTGTEQALATCEVSTVEEAVSFVDGVWRRWYEADSK